MKSEDVIRAKLASSPLNWLDQDITTMVVGIVPRGSTCLVYAQMTVVECCLLWTG